MKSRFGVNCVDQFHQNNQTWFEEWLKPEEPFKSMYLLRDFAYSTESYTHDENGIELEYINPEFLEMANLF